MFTSTRNYCCGCGVMIEPDSRFCMPCRWGVQGVDIPRLAFQMRLFGRPKFRPKRLAAFFNAYRDTITSSFDIETSSIKACEQVRKEVQNMIGQMDSSGRGGEYSREVAPRSPVRDSEMARYDELRTVVLKKFTGCCAYCQQPVSPDEEFQFDTVLPTGIEHSGMMRTRYYEFVFAMGNLAPSCSRCNTFKGLNEVSGLFRLKATQRQFTCATTEGTVLPSARVPLDLSGLYGEQKFSNAELTFEEGMDVQGLLKAVTLRVTAVCRHETQVRRILYDQDARTIKVGCEKCLPDPGAMSWTRSAKAASEALRKSTVNGKRSGSRLVHCE